MRRFPATKTKSEIAKGAIVGSLPSPFSEIILLAWLIAWILGSSIKIIGLVFWIIGMIFVYSWRGMKRASQIRIA